MLTAFPATVSTLNVATMVTFAELSFAFQLLLQRITQVLTVVMVSRMFLNLKGSIRYGSKGAESRGVPLSSGMMHVEASEIAASLETQVTGPNHMSTLVGNLGNDLMHSSILDHWILDEKVGENCFVLFLFTLHCYIPVVHHCPRTSTTITLRRRGRRPTFFQ